MKIAAFWLSSLRTRINKLCSRIFSFELHGFCALYNNCLRRRRTDILNVGESTQDVGEQGVGETTRRRNDRNSLWAPSLLCALPCWRFWQNCHFRHICQIRHYVLFFAIFVAVCISGHISTQIDKCTAACHLILSGVVTSPFPAVTKSMG